MSESQDKPLHSGKPQLGRSVRPRGRGVQAFIVVCNTLSVTITMSMPGLSSFKKQGNEFIQETTPISAARNTSLPHHSVRAFDFPH